MCSWVAQRRGKALFPYCNQHAMQSMNYITKSLSNVTESCTPLLQLPYPFHTHIFQWNKHHRCGDDTSSFSSFPLPISFPSSNPFFAVLNHTIGHSGPNFGPVQHKWLSHNTAQSHATRRGCRVLTWLDTFFCQTAAGRQSALWL
jgi:hypothetical protein